MPILLQFIKFQNPLSRLLPCKKNVGTLKPPSRYIDLMIRASVGSKKLRYGVISDTKKHRAQISKCGIYRYVGEGDKFQGWENGDVQKRVRK